MWAFRRWQEGAAVSAAVKTEASLTEAKAQFDAWEARMKMLEQRLKNAMGVCAAAGLEASKHYEH